MTESRNRQRSGSQLNSSDRNMDSNSEPVDTRSGQHISAGSSGTPGEARAAASDRQPRQTSDTDREAPAPAVDEHMDRNDSQDAAIELSDRGGIRPERQDPATYTDRSRDRQVKE